MNGPRDWDRVFHDDLAADAAVERRLLIKELLIAAVVIGLVVLREAML
jgi:hypothetical protein